MHRELWKFRLVAVRSDCIIDSTTARTCVRSARYARQSRRELNVPRRHPRTEGRFSRNVGKFRALAENVRLNEAQINDVSRALADVPSLIICTKRLYRARHISSLSLSRQVSLTSLSLFCNYKFRYEIHARNLKKDGEKNVNYLRFIFES